jgi:hypothetical protein
MISIARSGAQLEFGLFMIEWRRQTRCSVGCVQGDTYKQNCDFIAIQALKTPLRYEQSIALRNIIGCIKPVAVFLPPTDSGGVSWIQTRFD